MKFSKSVYFALLAIVTLSLGLAWPVVQDKKEMAKEATAAQETKAAETDETDDEQEFEPVDNMHHFMEYICEPSYKGLRAALETEPENRRAWKAFKNHALVLAETSKLVAERGPDDEAKSKEWKAISLAVYKSGKSLYKSAGKYEDAKKHYGMMIDQCNKCHTVFAEGKHQLKK